MLQSVSTVVQGMLSLGDNYLILILSDNTIVPVNVKTLAAETSISTSSITSSTSSNLSMYYCNTSNRTSSTTSSENSSICITNTALNLGVIVLSIDSTTNTVLSQKALISDSTAIISLSATSLDNSVLFAVLQSDLTTI